jgi:hypothetical protein
VDEIEGGVLDGRSFQLDLVEVDRGERTETSDSWFLER